jgi:flagellar hook-associated protein 1 FlgK
MSGISDALNSSSSHLASLGRSLAIIQSNVGNASTPGYARQDLGAALDSLSSEGQQQSSRDEFAEQAVRRQNSQLGHFDQLSSLLGQVEVNFGASSDAEIPKSIGNLFATFSALTANPNDSGFRQVILDRAAQLGRAFNSTAVALENIRSDTRQQVSSSVDTINHLAGLVRDFNISQITNGGTANPNVDAKLHATLEQLSEFADVQALKQSDGSITLLLGGQTPLVVGGNQYQIQADLASSPTVKIRDSSGADVTSLVTGGRLSGGLETINQRIPSYQTGLNQLAQGIADTVNAALAAGIDSSGNPGAALFTYTSPANAAASLASTGITTGQLAAAAPAAPGGNGNALALSALQTSPTVNGFTFAGFYGNLSAVVGRDVANAQDNQSTQKQLLAQARAHRTESSGVSLDEEAVRLVEYQRAYEATAKLVSVLDQLSADTLNMIH